MPNDLLRLRTPQALTSQTQEVDRPLPTTGESGTRGVNIRGVPYAVWQRARQNALLSNLPFKAYIIRLLAQSQPFRIGHPSVDTTAKDSNATEAKDAHSV